MTSIRFDRSTRWKAPRLEGAPSGAAWLGRLGHVSFRDAARGVPEEAPLRRHEGARRRGGVKAKDGARLCHPEAPRDRAALRLSPGMERSAPVVGGPQG